MFIPYLWVFVSLYILGDECEQPASSQGTLVLVDVYRRPRLQSRAFLSASSLVVPASLQRPSQGFGTGGMGHGVRHGLLWVAAVVVNLKQDGEVHGDL